MVAYYELTKYIYQHLIADEDINTVVIGNADNIDTNKQTMFPLAHILVGTATPKGGTVNFNVTVTTMDIVDIKKDDPDFSWKGQDDKQYILNTMFAVLENLEKSLDRGQLQELGWEILGDAQATPFEDQYENLLTGWSMTFNLSVPNTVQKCNTPSLAIRFKSFSSIDSDFSIEYTGEGLPVWTDGTQTFKGSSVTFNWTDSTTKTVDVSVIDHNLVSANLLYSDLDIFELDTQRTSGEFDLIDSLLESAPIKTVKRLYAPHYEDNTLVYFESIIQNLYLKRSLFTDALFDIRRCYSFEELVQPETQWSTAVFLLTDSVIPDTLNLNNLTINGSFGMDNNQFIEDITFNLNADWTLCNSIGITNSPLLGSIDFSIMTGLLTNNDTTIILTGANSTESELDNMLSNLVSIISDNGATGRSIKLDGVPSAAGLANKLILEGRGVVVTI